MEVHYFTGCFPPQARLMFEGEFASLEAISRTGCVRAPRPVKVLNAPPGSSGAMLVMEYLDLKYPNAKALGEAVAK